MNRDGSHDPNTNGSGLYWPGGIEATKAAVFEDGLLWGGYVKDSIQVNGNTFASGGWANRPCGTPIHVTHVSGLYTAASLQGGRNA